MKTLVLACPDNNSIVMLQVLDRDLQQDFHTFFCIAVQRRG
jgi:hypothetical protein